MHNRQQWYVLVSRRCIGTVECPGSFTLTQDWYFMAITTTIGEIPGCWRKMDRSYLLLMVIGLPPTRWLYHQIRLIYIFSSQWPATYKMFTWNRSVVQKDATADTRHLVEKIWTWSRCKGDFLNGIVTHRPNLYQINFLDRPWCDGDSITKLLNMHKL